MIRNSRKSWWRIVVGFAVPKSMPSTFTPYSARTAWRKNAAPDPTPARIPTRPTMLNQPVIQLQPAPPSLAAHQYGPPAVGNAEVSSAIENATNSTNAQSTGQPIEIAIGPPAFHANPKLVKHPARTEMIVNEI